MSGSLLLTQASVLDQITIRGARTHNLKNVDLQLPRNKLVVITGLSGSGKSSLAFDTLYAEGQRRYVESLSAYARQFLSIMEKPDVDHIDGLSPAISIEQKSTSHNPRSTVGTITEIYDYLRLLYARTGTPRCPEHGGSLDAQTVSQMVDQVLTFPEGKKLMLLAPVIRERKGEHYQLLESLRAQGFIRARIDGEMVELDEIPELELQKKHTIEVVVDRFKVRPDISLRLAESFESTLGLTDGIAVVAEMPEARGDVVEEWVFSAKFSCPHCGYNLSELEPRLFSFNSPVGACASCDGLGTDSFFDPELVVANPHLSLADGAIRSWDRRNSYYFQMITSLAAHYGFDVEMPFSALDESHQHILLFGSGKEQVELTYTNERGKLYQRTQSFEGIIPNMKRRYRDTESNMVRDSLARYLSERSCTSCNGMRLNEQARNVWVGDKNIAQVCELPVGQLQHYFPELTLEGHKAEIAEKIIREITLRLNFLVNVGLDYLSLSRNAGTLSGGEAQRIRLASQIGAGLVGVLYVLDEPSIGLHQRDNQKLIQTLTYLRDLGNTVIVVEHDEETIRAADYVVDMGPGAGVHGGSVVAQGTPEEIAANSASLTGQYLCGKQSIPVPSERVTLDPEKQLVLTGASGNNLDNITVSFPLGLMVCVTGVSGSGKSTLVNDTLYRIAAKQINRATGNPAPYQSLQGLDAIDKVIDINQSPIGRTPRSNPATYTGLFTPLRELLAATPEARSRGYAPGRFSFNVKGGRCEACKGDGLIKVEMHFLPDMYVPCDVCHAKRYNRETLEILYKGKNIHEILEMTVEDAREFFDPVPAVARRLQTMLEVGLGYITLGQSATTLSGGEAQRIKLSKELSKKDTGQTLYILDEPTTGLHIHDIKSLLDVLHTLRAHGNTIIVIEHNLDVIKTADWIIDIGPEGGNGGGQVVAVGTPEMLAEQSNSYTGQFLKPLLT